MSVVQSRRKYHIGLPDVNTGPAALAGIVTSENMIALLEIIDCSVRINPEAPGTGFTSHTVA